MFHVLILALYGTLSYQKAFALIGVTDLMVRSLESWEPRDAACNQYISCTLLFFARASSFTIFIQILVLPRTSFALPVAL